jgi:hypothetical protein
MSSGEYLDKGGLAGPILSKECHDLSWRNREVNVVERSHAGK